MLVVFRCKFIIYVNKYMAKKYIVIARKGKGKSDITFFKLVGYGSIKLPIAKDTANRPLNLVIDLLYCNDLVGASVYCDLVGASVYCIFQIIRVTFGMIIDFTVCV